MGNLDLDSIQVRWGGSLYHSLLFPAKLYKFTYLCIFSARNYMQATVLSVMEHLFTSALGALLCLISLARKYSFFVCR